MIVEDQSSFGSIGAQPCGCIAMSYGRLRNFRQLVKILGYISLVWHNGCGVTTLSVQ